MDEEVKTPQEYLAIAKRRKWHFIVPALGVFLLSALIAFLLPSVYRSAAVVLIEEPDVPRELVFSTVTSYADQRLQTIYQRATTTENLMQIINKFDLYAKEREVLPVTEVVDNMRENVSMELISADVIDPKTGRPGQATIAFSLAFEHDNPAITQKVASELVTLYLAKNIQSREETARETSDFLEKEADQLEAEIADLERQLSELKEKNLGSLPEQLHYNMQLIERGETELRDLERRAQALRQQKIYMQSELSQVSPFGSYQAGGVPVLSATDQLKALRTQFITISGRYGPEHPDVVKLRREIQALEQETGAGPDPALIRAEIRKVQTDLAVARQRYAESHPDVIKLKRQLSALQTSLAAAGEASSRPLSTQTADNPLYIQMSAQIQSVSSELAAVEEQKLRTKEKLTEYEERIMAIPLVEREYMRIVRELENASGSYQDIKTKLMTATRGEALEAERKSESFTLIEPPQLPTDPASPNRIAIVMLGFLLSLGAGVGGATLSEMLDQSVHNSKQLAVITGAAPLAVVPYIKTRDDTIRAWRRAVTYAAAGCVVLGVGLTFFHYNIKPLDVLWSVAQRRLDTILVQYF